MSTWHRREEGRTQSLKERHNHCAQVRAQLCPSDSATPLGVVDRGCRGCRQIVACQAPLSTRFFQARILEWVAISWEKHYVYPFPKWGKWVSKKKLKTGPGCTQWKVGSNLDSATPELGQHTTLVLKKRWPRRHGDRMGEIRAVLENLVPVLPRTWGNIPRDGNLAGFKSGYGEV